MLTKSEVCQHKAGALVALQERIQSWSERVRDCRASGPLSENGVAAEGEPITNKHHEKRPEGGGNYCCRICAENLLQELQQFQPRRELPELNYLLWNVAPWNCPRRDIHSWIDDPVNCHGRDLHCRKLDLGQIYSGQHNRARWLVQHAFCKFEMNDYAICG